MYNDNLNDTEYDDYNHGDNLNDNSFRSKNSDVWTTVLDLTAVFVIGVIVFILICICSGVLIWRSCRVNKEEPEAVEDIGGQPVTGEENKYYEIL